MKHDKEVFVYWIDSGTKPVEMVTSEYRYVQFVPEIRSLTESERYSLKKYYEKLERKM